MYFSDNNDDSNNNNNNIIIITIMMIMIMMMMIIKIIIEGHRGLIFMHLLKVYARSRTTSIDRFTRYS